MPLIETHSQFTVLLKDTSGARDGTTNSVRTMIMTIYIYTQTYSIYNVETVVKFLILAKQVETLSKLKKGSEIRQTFHSFQSFITSQYITIDFFSFCCFLLYVF